MASVRRFRRFKDEELILLALSRAELPLLHEALRALSSGGDQTAAFDGCRLALKRHSSTGMIVTGSDAELCLTEADIEQVEGLVAGLMQSGEPGHHYLDLDWPVPTLMIAVDEYPADFA